ncbi:MAG: hypothetical protein ACI9EF_000363 [Pseudohongiellaceae bacterium]|jgi:hypothetical protein
MRRALLTLFASAALFTSSAAADVIVIDLENGETIQAAIDAVSSGDTILVEGTKSAVSTSEFAVDVGKGLTLIGEVPGANPRFFIRRVAVRNLPAGQDVTFVQMNVSGPGGEGLSLTNNTGSVSFYDVHVEGAQGQSENGQGQLPLPGNTGTFINSCNTVHFVNSFIEGREGGNVLSGIGLATTPGGAGMEANNSSISFFNAAARGGQGGSSGFIYSPKADAGGPGTIATDSKLHLNNSFFQGGPAGEDGTGGSLSTPGGLGYQQNGVSAVATLRRCAFSGGAGFGVSPMGPASHIVAGAVVTYPSPIGLMRIEGNSPVREAEPIIVNGLQIMGGTQVFLLTGFAPGYLSLPSREGVLTLGLPVATDLILIGTSPTITFNNHFSLGNAPLLPLGFEEVHLYLQTIEIPASAPATLGAPQHLTILAAGF